MSSFGQLMICIAAVLSAAGGALMLAGGERRGLLDAGNKLLHAAAAAATVTLLILVFLLVSHDYRVAYVRDSADRTMTVVYLVMGIWGGQEGGLLLWAVLQAWFTSAAAHLIKNKLGDEGGAGPDIDGLRPVALGFLAALQVFFFLLTVFYSNPFEPLGTTATSGIGLNPLLRNPYMAIHPPSLYIGFVGFSVPMAFALAALVQGGGDHRWLEALRPWILFAWIFLSVGNLLGMVWAYEELGWGGYWGWDPVENASFMPWLTGTALVHTAIVLKARKLFYPTSLILIYITFALVVFGTFLTRSGIIQSMHAFTGSNTGPYFLGLIAVTAVLFIALLAARWKAIASKKSMDSVLSSEGLFFITNLAFVLSAAFVWLATMAPFFTEIFKGEQVAVTPEFFNRWMAPAGLAIIALIGLCTVIGWRPWNGKTLIGRFRAPAAGAGVAILAALGLWRGSRVQWDSKALLSIICLALAGLLIVSAVRELTAIFRKAAADQSVTKSRRRRMGAHLVHLAVATLFIGFSGAARTEEQSGSLGIGQTMRIGEYSLTLMGLREDNDFERRALLADLEVRKDGASQGIFSPARYTYHSHPNKPTSEVVIKTTLAEDLFLILGSGDPEQGWAVVRAVVNPLVIWIWIGGVLLVIGGVTAVFPGGWLGAVYSEGRRLKPNFVKAAVSIVFAAAVGVGVGTARDLTAAVVALAGMCLALMLLLFSNAMMILAGEVER